MNSQNINDIYEKLKGMKSSCVCDHFGNAITFNADCFAALKDLPDSCIDSAVIDGPYGIGHMGKEWDNFKPNAIMQATGGIDNSPGISPSMFAGHYDISRRGTVRFQQFCFEWATELYRVLKPGAYLCSFCSPRLYHRMATGIEDAGFQVVDQMQWLFGQGLPKSQNISLGIDKMHGAERTIVGPNPNRKGRQNWDNNPKNITLPATQEAIEWDGWGTALKSTHEPILLARKPIIEHSIARNVLKYGTGALHIDACRIGDKKRFPSNVMVDNEVADLLGDKSKFFYCPKISNKERNAGCEPLDPKIQKSDDKGRTYNDRCGVCGNKFIGSEGTRCQCPPGVKVTDKTAYRNRNHHPTVKPVALMEYLVTLITPPNGICIDIFMGSGSTGIACSNHNFGFIGIEQEPEYYTIAMARIKHWQTIKKVA